MTARISSIPGKTRAHRARLQWRILLKSQFDRLCEALQRFFFGLTLAICARNLGTVCNEPRTILLDDCCKFVCHGVPCCSDSLSQREEERTGARLSVQRFHYCCGGAPRWIGPPPPGGAPCGPAPGGPPAPRPPRPGRRSSGSRLK